MLTANDHANAVIHEHAPKAIDAALKELVARAATLGDGHVLALRRAAANLRACDPITDRVSANVAIEIAAKGFDAAQDASVWARYNVDRAMAFRLSCAAWACISAANTVGWVKEILAGTFMPAVATYRAGLEAAQVAELAAIIGIPELPPGLSP